MSSRLRLKLLVNVSESIRRGIASPRDVVVTISNQDLEELSPEERESFAANIRSAEGRDCDASYSSSVPEPTIAGVLESIRETAAKESAEREKKKHLEAEAQRIAESIPLPDSLPWSEYHHRPDVKGLIPDDTDWELRTPLMEALQNLPGIKALADASLRAFKEEEAERAEKKRKRREEEERQAKERKAASNRERNQWIESHGSNRLKRMLKEDIECHATYLQERLALERPGWVYELDGDYDEIENPNEDAFELLDEARKSDSDATLVKYTPPSNDEYDYFEEEASPIPVATSTFLGETIIFLMPAKDSPIASDVVLVDTDK